MSDLKRYRIDKEDLQLRNPDYLYAKAGDIEGDPFVGVLVPDDTLQQIADAWQLYRELYRIDPSATETDTAWNLAISLFDALVEGNEDELPELEAGSWGNRGGGER